MARKRQLAEILRLSTAIGMTMDLDHETNVFIDWLAKAVRPRAAALFLRLEGKQALQLVQVHGFEPPADRLLPIGLDPWRWLAEQGVRVIKERDPQCYVIPVPIEDQTSGILCVVSRCPPERLSDEQHLVSIATHCLGPVLRNIRRYRALEHQFAEQTNALAESEARYQRLFEHVPIGLYRSTPDGRVLDANPALVEMLRYPDRASFLRINAVDLFVDPRERRRWQALIEQNGIVRDFEARWRRYDGQIIWVRDSARVVRDSGGRVVYYEGAVEDITAHKQAEERLRLQVTALEAVANAIVITDREGTILWVNPAFTHLTGYTAQEAIGQTPRILKSGKQDRSFYKNLWDTILSGQVWHGELINRRKDGSLYTEEMTITPVRDHRGEISRFIAIKQDITERRRAEEQIRRLAMKLKAIARPARQMTALLKVDQLVQQVVQSLQEVTGCYSANLFLIENHELVFVAGQGGYRDGKPPIGYRLPLDRGIIGHVVQTGEPWLSADTTQDPYYLAWDGLPHTRSELAVPVKLGEQVLGVIDIQDIEPNAFDETDIEMLCVLADQLAIALENARLFEETHRRAEELEALARVSSALRTASTRAEMLPIILDQLLDLLQAKGAAFAMQDPTTGDTVIELARGSWAGWTGKRLPPGEGISGHVIATGRPYVSDDVHNDPRGVQPHLPGVLHAVACVPLIAHERTIGALWVGRQAAFTAGEVRLLTAIADMAANAIHRATLHEQTQQRLQHLTVLRRIDTAITGSLDLHVILNVLLDQVTSQLGIHAAAVLLFNPYMHTLEYAAARGFYSDAIRQVRLRLGEGYAGRAALERRPVSIRNLQRSRDAIARTVFVREGFITYHAVPLIAKGQVKGVLEIFHREPFDPTSEWLEFLEILAAQAAIAIDNATLLEDLQRSNIELVLAYDTTLEGWARALELRDQETQGHTQRVTEMTLRLARAMGIPDDELVHIRRGALLHDIGKMGIPDTILLKPGPLTEEEWQIMRRHPIYAYEMLAPITYLRQALEIPYCHHEKWDGTGYPRGLKGEEIPLSARIFAVVDVYDALCSDRPYRRAWPREKARRYIQEQAGKHFDPRIVSRFLKLLEDESQGPSRKK